MMEDLKHHFHFHSNRISFNGDGALEGDGRANRKTMINGHDSRDNTLIMKSMQIEIEMK